ncbi:hypothetical protein [Vagococcus fluvialis]|uniref:hypothetical protein n=1 Tax=Vagococcus fluvialis TaxID=2738 RepID=UPI0037ACB9A1
MTQEALKKELKRYGFIYLEGTVSENHARQFLTVKKMTQREALIFKPKKEICFERMLSKQTSLYIEGLERFDAAGNYLGYSYDFYKATYLYDSQPRRLKIYGTQLSTRELLFKLKGFSFLLSE